MKRLVFLVVWLFLFSAFSFAQAPQNQGCTLEQVINFRPAVDLAQYDYLVAINNAQQQATSNPFLFAQTFI